MLAVDKKTKIGNDRLKHITQIHPSSFSLAIQISFSLCSPASVFLDQQGGFIGSRYKKVVYRQFTSDKFKTQVERTADMEHLGIMGELSGQQGEKNTNVYLYRPCTGNVMDLFVFSPIGQDYLTPTLTPSRRSDDSC